MAAITAARAYDLRHDLLLDTGVVATAAVGGGAAASMPLLYRRHAGANAAFGQLMRTAAKPAIVGGAIGAAAGIGLALGMREHRESVLTGAGMGAAMGGLLFAGNGLSAIGRPINGRVPSALRVLAGPIMLGAGIGSVVGLAAGAIRAASASSGAAD